MALLMFPLALVAAPKADLWGFWNDASEDSIEVVSHEKWQTILDRYLVVNQEDQVNRFAYKRLTADDRGLLKSYLRDLAAIDPRRLNRDEQFAYWVNLYNALTVELVLKKYPVSSIRKIRYLSSLFGPWDKKLIRVAGERLSLNDIEHRILRPIWRDPRIHFVVNCASLGCPNLPIEALSSKNIESVLENAATDFINHARGVSRRGETLVLSSIFDWYRVDFGSNNEEMLVYLRRFLSADRASFLEHNQGLIFEYDWSLNDAAP